MNVIVMSNGPAAVEPDLITLQFPPQLEMWLYEYFGNSVTIGQEVYNSSGSIHVYLKVFFIPIRDYLPY